MGWGHGVLTRLTRATHVPVGDDQKQHLEFARECATHFNHAFGRHLVTPKTITCRSYNPPTSHLWDLRY
ncbi:hypothetical protein [Salmonella enterica]|uniref:hypothetical protein n=1 Tax=Salmonella enterica TaxID=28901 RepID=UPI0034D9722D